MSGVGAGEGLPDSLTRGALGARWQRRCFHLGLVPAGPQIAGAAPWAEVTSRHWRPRLQWVTGEDVAELQHQTIPGGRV